MELTAFARPHQALVTPRDAALEYASRGLPVLPLNSVTESTDGLICTCRDPECSRVGKHPLTWHGLSDATLRPKVIKAWFARWPWANVGIRMGRESGLICLDTDVWKGSDAALADWEFQGHFLDSSLRGLTGRGGQLFFQHPGGYVVSLEGGFAPAIDTRGDGSYVVAPPSRHENGDYYSWLKDGTAPELPRWALEVLVPLIREAAPPQTSGTRSALAARLGSPYGMGALLDEVCQLEATSHRRNEQFSKSVRAMFELVAGGELDGAEVEQILREAAAEIGLEAKEINRSLKHNMAKGLLTPRKAPGRTGALPNKLRADLARLRILLPDLLTDSRNMRLRDRAAYGSILDLVEFKARSHNFDLSVRELADRIGISKTSASAALKSLRRQKRITRIARGAHGNASIYRLARPPAGMTPKPPSSHDDSVSRTPLHTATPCVETYVPLSAKMGDDVFRRGYANKSGAFVYEALMTADALLTTTQVAGAAKVSWGTAKAALVRLESLGMAGRKGKRWAGIDVDLNEIALEVGAAGIGQRQHEQHVAEREEFNKWREVNEPQEES